MPSELYLEVCDDGVLHIFLLLLQEVVGHGVQSVGTQLEVSQQHLQNKSS